jgi:DNA-3-methyladenine glycosylase
VSGADEPGAFPGVAFFERPAETVARELLGTFLLSTVGDRHAVGRIVETEAYTGPDDPASHAARRIGRTRRNAAMFGPPGKAYVYRIYGIHWCLNIVTDVAGFPSAVLIRAIEAVEGLPVMRERRTKRSPVADAALGRGPGNVAAALGITGDLDGHALDRPPLRLLGGQRVPDREVERGPRVGVSRAVEWPLRFWVRGNPAVSRR